MLKIDESRSLGPASRPASNDTMTRPNIVRADTIDLQDQDSPSAAEHHRPALQNGLAPHQRAEVHHVLEERSSEEHALADVREVPRKHPDKV